MKQISIYDATHKKKFSWEEFTHSTRQGTIKEQTGGKIYLSHKRKGEELIAKTSTNLVGVQLDCSLFSKASSNVNEEDFYKVKKELIKRYSTLVYAAFSYEEERALLLFSAKKYEESNHVEWWRYYRDLILKSKILPLGLHLIGIGEWKKQYLFTVNDTDAYFCETLN